MIIQDNWTHHAEQVIELLLYPLDAGARVHGDHCSYPVTLTTIPHYSIYPGATPRVWTGDSGTGPDAAL